MAQAIELPDPLDAPPAGAGGSSTSVDDLLAQLASDEIDRLLVEAESETQVTAQAEADAEAKDTAALIAIASEQIATDEATGLPADRESVDATAIEPEPEATLAAPAAELATRVMAEPSIAENETVESLDDAIAASVVLPSDAGEVEKPAAATPEVIAEAAQERTELLAAIAADPAAVAEQIEKPLPRWLAPLEWLTFPQISDRTREALGKAAIVTLVNSAAIILYVVLTRKH